MTKDYSHLLVASYEHWKVYVHPNQEYLGRCIVWCRRGDALTLTDATNAEQRELFKVLRELQEALRICFQPDLLNFAFLGNETHHLHGHVIPRYKDTRNFMGILFDDDRWGQNYRTSHLYGFGQDLLQGVKSSLQKTLGRGE